MGSANAIHIVDTTKSHRIRFIDTARAIAILAMLIGHFFGMSLASEYHSNNYAGYQLWVFLRTYTAPLFITLSGATTAYLFAQQDDPDAVFPRRVRRTAIRALQLVAWGVVLHLNLLHLERYLHGHIEAWAFTFHVLQCIGVGLLALIVIFFLHRHLIRRGHISIYYALAATAVLIFSAHLATLPPDTYFPPRTHVVIQNAFVGPNSVFPVAPWTAFLLYGAALGSLLKPSRSKHRNNAFALVLLFVGLLTWLAAPYALGYSNYFLHRHLSFEMNLNHLSYLYVRIGAVLLFLALLMFAENAMPRLVPDWFHNIGRRTLLIYILHAILLYGGLIGIGLSSYLRGTMNNWQAMIASVGFTVTLAAVGHWFPKLLPANKQDAQPALKPSPTSR